MPTQSCADDTYLLVSATDTISIPQELQHLSYRPSANNPKLNNAKWQEMIVHPATKQMTIIFLSHCNTRINEIDKMAYLGPQYVTPSPVMLLLLLRKVHARTLYAYLQYTIRAHGL